MILTLIGLLLLDGDIFDFGFLPRSENLWVTIDDMRRLKESGRGLLLGRRWISLGEIILRNGIDVLCKMIVLSLILLKRLSRIYDRRRG